MTELAAERILTLDAFARGTASPGLGLPGTLREVEWPDLEIVRSDPESHVRAWKKDGPVIRTAGSLSVVRQVATPKLVDRLRVILCPLVLPRTGVEPAFEGCDDLEFDLVDTKVLDGRVLVLAYEPRAHHRCPEARSGSAQLLLQENGRQRQPRYQPDPS